MVDSGGVWNLVSAKRIPKALEGLPVHWLEDMVWQEDVEDWHELRATTTLAIAGSERLLGRRQMRRMLEANGTDVWIGDVTWTGGISEAKKMAAMAEAYGTSFAGHDHSGPVNLWASAHISLNVPNAYIMESSRAFYDPRFGYYHEVVEGEPIARNGFLYPPRGPGLGIRLRPEFLSRQDVEIVASEPQG